VPETHPFWTSREEELPRHSIPRIKALPHPKHIMRYVGLLDLSRTRGPPSPPLFRHRDHEQGLTDICGHNANSYTGNHCMLLSSGQACSYPMRGTHAKYGAFAYSSAFAYSVPTGCFGLEQFALASQLGLSDDGGEVWKPRRLCEYAAIEARDDEDENKDKNKDRDKDKGGRPVLVSVWRPFADVRVKTWLIPPVEGEVEIGGGT
jgi:hypothetical protein